jgi:hypothetical protein
MLESLTRHNGMVSLGILDKLKYWNIKEDMNDVECCVHQIQIEALEVFEVIMNI